MRIGHWLRLLIGSFVVIFLILTFFSFLFPSRVRISRAMNVKASTEEIKAPLADLRRWNEWNPFLDSVAAGTMIFSGGNGVPNEMRIEDVRVNWVNTEGSDLVAEMKGLTGKPVTCGWQIIEHPDSDSTTVQWYMDFKLGWLPWQKFSGLLLENSYGPRMEQGLTRLRQLVYNDRSSKTADASGR